MTKTFTRRGFTAFAAAGAAVLAAATAGAQTAWPSKPITIVVPFAPGGGTDALARAVAQKMQLSLGQPVVVDNRAGAGGTIGAAFAAKAPADGHTLLMLNVLPHTASTALYKNLSFDPVRNFTALGLVGSTPYLVTVHPSVPARTLPEFVAAAKANKGAFNYGSSGPGGVSHLSTELFKRTAGVDLTHVPYKGDGPVVTDLLGGQIQVSFGNVIAMLPHVKAGKLRALAVTGDSRMDILPDVPTVKESGYPDYSVVGQFGLAVPAGTPPGVIKRLNEAIVAAVQAPDVSSTFATQGVTPRTSTPEQMQAMMQAQQQLWSGLIRDLGLTAE